MIVRLTMPTVPPSTARLDDLEARVDSIRNVVDKMLTMLDKLTTDHDAGDEWKRP